MAEQKPKKAKKPRNYTTSGSTDRPKPGTTKSKPSSKTDKQTAATKATSVKAGGKKPAPNMEERIEGLQGWMAEIERKQARMTYFGAAAALVAIAAAAAALYLAVTTKDDAATKDDVDEIQTQLEGTQREVQSSINKGLKDTLDRLATLEQSVSDLRKKQAQDASDIATLQNQANAANAANAGQAGGGGTGLGANPNRR